MDGGEVLSVKEKVVLFTFDGEAMCFVHVLLNGLDMNGKGHEVKIVIEGAATALVPQVARPDHFLNALYLKTKGARLIVGACRACSAKMGVLQAVEAEGLPLLGDMSGHPSMAAYMEEGFRIITF